VLAVQDITLPRAVLGLGVFPLCNLPRDALKVKANAFDLLFRRAQEFERVLSAK
jgi:hypothetical protein